MNGAGLSWQSEQAWSGSGGGLLANMPIPSYQKAMNFSTNGGSPMFRNAPDLSLVASGIAIVADNGAQETASGTSAASPLWAGLLALVNEKAQKGGQGTVGFVNPLLTTIGLSALRYSAEFNDMTVGNNVVATPNQFNAVTGFDLATGWGAPKAGLVNDLSGVPAPGTPLVTIRYHQVGACNGFVDSFGGVSAGPNAAFVVFALESVDNSGTASNLAFDPQLLFVHQSVDEFIDSGLKIATEIIGSASEVQPSTVLAGKVLNFSPSKFGPLVVATSDSNGATEANQTAYFLRYKAAPTDPVVFLIKSDATRTSFPTTEDCKTIVFK
jgi:hypothetical protein